MEHPAPYPDGHEKCKTCHKLESHYLDELATVVAAKLRLERLCNQIEGLLAADESMCAPAPKEAPEIPESSDGEPSEHKD